MRILITGTSGFMGAHLAHAAAKDNDVLGIDIVTPDLAHLPYKFQNCDIRDEAALNAIFGNFEPELVLHLAARTDLNGRSIEDYSSNTLGTKTLLFSAAKTPSVRRVIYTSSQLVCRPGEQPDSDEYFAPENPYGASKAEGERIVRHHDGGGCEWCIVRPTTIWGPGMGTHYRKFLSLIQSGRYFHIGRSPLHKSYGYVGNTVFQYLQLASAPSEAIRGKVFYLADYEPLSLRDWAEQLRHALLGRRIRTMPIPVARAAAACGDLMKALGVRNVPLTSFRLRNMLTEYCVELKSTEQVCGALPYTIEQGVAATAEWYESLK